VLSLLILFGCGSLVVTLFAIINSAQSGTEDTQLYAAMITSRTSKTAFIVAIGVATIAFDVLIFGLIAAKGILLYKSLKLLRQSHTKSLVEVILEDGSLYFLAMTIVNLVTFLAMAGVVTIGGEPLYLHAVGLNTLPSISVSTALISRLVLNLRKQARGPSEGGLATVELTTFRAQPNRPEAQLHSRLSELNES